MFGLSEATELIQGSTERTWNCVLHFVHLLWSKLNHISQPIMPKSRKRHHSRSRSRSRSHSRDRSRERDDKHKKNDSHDKDRDGKRRKIDSYDSPPIKRSVRIVGTLERGIPETPENLVNDCLISTTCPRTAATTALLTTTLSGSCDLLAVDPVSVNVLNKSASATPESEEIQSNAPEGNCETPSCQSYSKSNLAEDESKEQTDCIETPVDNDEKEEIANKEVMEVDPDLPGTEENENDNSVITSNEEVFEPSTKGSTLDKTKDKLDITPKKALSPKQMIKRMESEKKRIEKLKEKEEKERKRNEERRERERKKNEEKERLEKEKQKKKEEKQRELELKQKEKEMKEEQKKKEREEKEQKRKEREEKEEQKRKEREQEKIKKQQEIDEKNKEKQKEEEKKQKAAAAFVNFFVAKKTDNQSDDKKPEEIQTSVFMAFEVKSDMKLPPLRRHPLSEQQKQNLDEFIETQNESSNYIEELKSGKAIRKSTKTWPYEETVDDDVEIIEEEGNLGETIYEDEKLQKFRAKFLKFHENRRPAYFGTWRKTSKLVKPRKPFAEDTDHFNYEEDSDDDWEEEEQGESLNGSDEEADKENEDEKDDYEVDNEFFVPHGHLSDDEIDDEETARLSPESLKQKLKLLKDEFDQDMQSKTHKLKPRSIGCIWYNKDGSNVEEAIHRYLQPLAMLTNGQIEIKDRTFSVNPGNRKNKSAKKLNPEYVPMFLKLVHGKQHSKNLLVEEFKTYMINNGFTVDVAKSSLIKTLKEHVSWKKCKKNGPLKNKRCWFVNEDAKQKFNIDVDESSEGTNN